jgi:hypothetical protein
MTNKIIFDFNQPTTELLNMNGFNCELNLYETVKPSRDNAPQNRKIE